MNILINLQKGYGLGDAVQMSAVLQHVAKYRPEWHVDYQAQEGQHQVGRGLVANTFAYGEHYPSQHYEAEVHILLFDTWANWGDRPNTRVSSCLHERFGLGWDVSCGRYKIHVSDRAKRAVSMLVSTNYRESPEMRRVAVHYRGDSSPDKKNLSHSQADKICSCIEKLYYTPLIIDWRDESPLSDEYNTTGKIPMAKVWGPDAEMNCAVISQCRAFVGIDSGPSKCASSTDTPALVIWTGHHPAPFHDPAPNTTHLVPYGYHGLEPVCNDRGVIRWFEENYNVRFYDSDPVHEVGRWLKEVLT